MIVLIHFALCVERRKSTGAPPTAAADRDATIGTKIKLSGLASELIADLELRPT